MQFHDGKFKILLLADIQDTDTPRRPTKDLLCAALDKTKPDLAVLLGDNTGGNWPRVDVRRTQKAVDAVARELYNRGRLRSCSATTTTRGFATRKTA